MARVVTIAIFLLHCGWQVSSLQAQLRGYGQAPAAREPARVGLLGGIREAREDRFRREAQVAATAARAAAAGSAAATNNLLRRDPVTGAVPPASLAAAANQRSIEAARAANLARASNYGGANLRSPNANSSAFNNANRPSTYVAPASARAFVPAPMSDDMNYDGPGVAIRLPEDARGAVNYLVDDEENNTVRPGQQQVLDAKESFVIRYSRGVTADGRSFGESRYTVTEGSYRFELTETGWELYRESVGEGQLAPPNRIEVAENNFLSRQSAAERLRPLTDRSFDGFPSSQSQLTGPQPSATRELPTESLATERPESSVAEFGVTESSIAEAGILVPDPAVPTKPSEPAESVNAEELPAPKPRSILEK